MRSLSEMLGKSYKNVSLNALTRQTKSLYFQKVKNSPKRQANAMVTNSSLRKMDQEIGKLVTKSSATSIKSLQGQEVAKLYDTKGNLIGVMGDDLIARLRDSNDLVISKILQSTSTDEI
jgi:hypothetical protein